MFIDTVLVPGMVYITVRYGESQQEIFNPNCKTYLLLKSIKRKCKCEREADIELSDESGNIKNLRDPGFQHRYANEFLDEREKLVLLKVEHAQCKALIHRTSVYSLVRRTWSGRGTLAEGTHHVSYRPMLQSGDAILNDDFLARLAIKGEQMHDGRRAKSNTRRKEKPPSETKDVARQSSREKNADKGKTSRSDKRLSARSKR